MNREPCPCKPCPKDHCVNGRIPGKDANGDYELHTCPTCQGRGRVRPEVGDAEVEVAAQKEREG